MKVVSCAIWIAVALLVAAPLDTVPDPPAFHPNISVGKLLETQDHSCDIARSPCDSLAVGDLAPFSFVLRDTGEANHPSDCVMLTGQATDTSPPLLQHTPHPAVQS